MERELSQKISNRSLSSNASIVDALKKMDNNDIKLLIVLKDDCFFGLLSLGDIQRAILDKVSLDSEVNLIMRSDNKIASMNMTEEEIRSLMIEERIECMPVIENNEIVDVYFWDDLFSKQEKKKRLHVPVVIMAGGIGSRLKPLTNIIPKALVPIGEKPIIEIIMDSFAEYGVSDFFLTVNYKSEMIVRYFNDIEHSYNISYFKEDKPLGTAGSMYMLKEKVTGTFFVTNCDILIKQNYNDIYKYHRENNNDLTIIASLKHYKIPYGTIETGKNGELLSMEEKPELTFMINTGMYVLEADILNELKDNEFIHITDLIDDLKKMNKKIGVFPVSEKSWMDMGQWEEYHQTLKDYELKFKK